MTDFLTPAERSERMSRIKGKDTVPELVIRKILHSHGLRYRLGGAGLPGKPDLVFPRYKAVVFVHGCFWHRHAGCKIASMPKSNVDTWRAKFERNVARDARVTKELQDRGWRVFVVWECELSPTTKASVIGAKLAELIRATLDKRKGSTPLK